MTKIICLGILLGCSLIGWSQDSIPVKTLEGVTLSANKWEQKLNEVPNKITKISKQQILLYNPQTAADMLSQSGTVFVQKSQLGGGSPMIRGFATNRVLLVVDGVRMNNAIYRNGNIQNVISIDPLSLETSEVIFGPGSLIYGSDAIGGVMDFHTLQPVFSNEKKPVFKGSALSRYSTANHEKTIHADLNLGYRKLSFLASYSFSEFDDLKMGKHGRDVNYLRPEYVDRIDGKDSIVKNSDPRVQKFTGYQQHNFLGKIRYKISEHVDLQYAFTYANTGNTPRYDRLIQYRNGALRFAEWYYGPMEWKMHTLTAIITKKSAIADRINLNAGYQDYRESRIDRARNNNTRTTQSETVDAFNFNADATKAIGKAELFYGLEFVHNKVGSKGKQRNISSGAEVPYTSRYPDGSVWTTAGLYAAYKINLNERLTMHLGARYSYNSLNAEFDTNLMKFPYEEASMEDGALTGNAGIVFRPSDGWQLNGNFSTGYRMPNVDDVGKLFESTPGYITVPNPDLKPEYALNFEVGIVREIDKKLKLELNGFHTILQDAIVKRPFQFNGQDSIMFDGSMKYVEALQNVAKATVWGVQASARFYFLESLFLQMNANRIWGKETDDAKDEQVPLRHAPPFYGSAQLNYKKNRITAELYSFYNSEVRFRDMAPSEQAKPDVYAKDADGNPFSPSWYTVNAKVSYRLTNHLTLAAGWENITNQRYRPYSSGVVAAGSNLIFSARVNF